MVLALRLQSIGIRNHPLFRIVVAETRWRRDGKFVERLGTFEPLPKAENTTPSFAFLSEEAREQELLIRNVVWDTTRLKYWISRGIPMSKAVADLLSKGGLIPPVPEGFDPKRIIPSEGPENWLHEENQRAIEVQKVRKRKAKIRADRAKNKKS